MTDPEPTPPTPTPCPGDGTHYFHKDERRCFNCGRYLLDHESSK